MQANNKSNKHKRQKDLLPEFNLTPWGLRLCWVTHKGWPLHLGHFPPSSDHKNQARVTYSISRWYKLPWAAATFGCSKVTPNWLGDKSSKSNKHEMCQLSEERGTLEMGNQLTSTFQALALKPILNPQQILPNQGQEE
jgi:hypothetical protein